MKHSFPRFLFVSILLFCFAALPVSFAQNGTPWTLAHHTPGFIAKANDLGPEDASKITTIRVWLKLQNSSALDQRLSQLNDPNSPQYHHWLTQREFKANYAPKADDAALVRNFLAEHNLKVVNTGGSAAYVTAQGRIADVQNAFNVQIHKFELDGKVYRANTTDPSIHDAAGAVVASIGGLSDFGMTPHIVKPHFQTAESAEGLGLTLIPLSQAPNGFFFSGQCFRAPETHTFTSSTATATYEGNRFGTDITNNQLGTLPPCGYQPSEMQTAYNLSPLYREALDGTGQTVVIVDAFGSTTIQQDVDTFSALYNLPPVNVTIVGTPTASPFDSNGNKAGWALETTLDVEWAHAVAPGANIVLVVGTTNSDADLAAAVQLAADQDLGNVISNSYGLPESLEDAAGFQAFESAFKTAAAKGIAINVSSGDSGDFFEALGYLDVSYPASSALATAIGGVSVGLNSDNTIKLQTGWGNNLTRIAGRLPANAPVVPPLNDPSLGLGFQFGSGGGVSRVFARPHFQNKLHASKRLLPDISWVADPFTGVEVILSVDAAGDQAVTVIGGTSVACPMFSGLWAIAAQRAGEPLGQAAEQVYNLPKKAVTDVTAVGSAADVQGVIQTSAGPTFESAAALAAPLGNTSVFYSAMYNSPFSTRWFVITFGTDSSLTTTGGWDNVTGVGTPNGAEFVDAVAHRNDR